MSNVWPPPSNIIVAFQWKIPINRVIIKCIYKGRQKIVTIWRAVEFTSDVSLQLYQHTIPTG